MHYTVTLDITSEKALELLRNLENLHLIRLHENTLKPKDTSAIRYLKGKMTKQSPEEIERIFKEMRGR
ncbi:MAG: hypothetical protein ACO1N1_26170 [Dyadobacter fermentans]